MQSSTRLYHLQKLRELKGKIHERFFNQVSCLNTNFSTTLLTFLTSRDQDDTLRRFRDGGGNGLSDTAVSTENISVHSSRSACGGRVRVAHWQHLTPLGGDPSTLKTFTLEKTGWSHLSRLSHEKCLAPLPVRKLSFCRGKRS